MSRVDTVLERLRRESELTSRGAFTIDRERAREKMRQFQLADPHRWIVLLVRAAAQRGAKKISVHVDSGGVQVDFDGPPLTRTDFEELYASIFAGSETPAIQARRELALAFNAAMALTPVFLRVESGERRNAIAFETRPGTDDVIEPCEHEIDGTRVRLVHGTGYAVLEMLRRDGQTRPERRLLREACAWSDVVIELDGEQISGGRDALRGLGEQPLADGRGSCVFRREGGPARLTVLQHGIVLTSRSVPTLPTGLLAVVDGSHLRTDVSRSEPTEDEAWAQLLAEVNAAAERCITALACEAADVSRHAGIPAFLWEVFRERLSMLGPVALDRAGDLGRALVELPLWRRADGVVQTTRALASSAIVAYTTAHVADQLPSHRRELVVATSTDVALLRRVLPRAVDLTEVVTREIERERQLASRRAHPYPLRLPDSGWLASHELAVGSVRVAIGVRSDGVETSTIRLVHDGLLSAEIEGALPFPVVVLVGTELAPEERGEGPLARDKLAEALRGVLDALAAVIERLASELLADPERLRQRTPRLRGAFLGYLHAVATDAIGPTLLRRFGFTPAQTEAALPVESRPRLPKLEPAAGMDHVLWQLPLLRALDRRHGAGVSIGALARGTCGPVRLATAADEHDERANGDVVLVDDATLALLTSLLGATRVESWRRASAEDAGRAKFLARSQVWKPRLESLAFGPIEIEHDGVRCTIGILAAVGTAAVRETARVRVMRERRLLTEMQVPCPVPGVTAIVVADDLGANRQWTALADDTSRHRVLAALGAGLHELVAAVLVSDTTSAQARLVLSAAACAVSVEPATDRASACLHAALVPHQPKLRALKRELQPSTPVVREQSPPVSQARIDESRDSPLAPTHQLVSPPAPAEQRSPAPAVMTAPVTATDLPPELPVGAEEQEQPPGVESTPIAPPSVATPERRLANAVVDELREILRQDPNIVGDPRLELIEVRELDDDALACVVGDSVVLGAAHPIVGAALRGEPLDPLLVAFLASAVYTAVNTWLEEITDEHEARFIAAHAARASRALAPNH